MREVIADVMTGKWFTNGGPFQAHLTWTGSPLTLITGPNCSGKSVLRKVLHNHCADRGLSYVSVSQEQRVASNGLQRLMVYGTESDESTGYNSVKMLLKCFQSLRSFERPTVIILDEPEIGCSEETQAGIGQRLAQEMADRPPLLQGFFVVTHSRELVRQVLPAAPNHWRLGGDEMSLEQFISREVVPANLDDVKKEGLEMWHRVNKTKGGL